MELLTLLPPAIAIFVAFATKRVLLSLFLAVLCATFLIEDYSFFSGLSKALEIFVALFKEAWIVYSLLFVVLVGPIIRLLQDSNAVHAFVNYLTVRHQFVNSKRGALFMGMFTGMVIFIESTLTSLIVATVTKPFARKYQISREKIAYLCDSTSAPLCTIIPINGWGALLIGLISTVIASLNLEGVSAVGILFEAVLFNFYAFVALGMLGWVIYKDKDWGAMKKIHTPYETVPVDLTIQHRLFDFIMPIASLLIILFSSLFVTGQGDMMKGDGSLSLFISVSGTLLLMYIQYVWFGTMKDDRFMQSFWQGINELVPIAVILLFAFTFSNALQELGTARFMGSLVSSHISVYFIPGLIFVISAVMAFATGTSWGTFTIMIPIATLTVDPHILPPSLLIGAVISGGVFGDHASPISDTTILSSLAAESNHINHVKTQLPYALLSAVISLFLFLLVTYIWLHL